MYDSRKMKICLLGETYGTLDEGARNITFHLSKVLSKDHQILPLDLRNIFSKNFWDDLKSFDPQLIHYIHGGSSKGFGLLKLISLHFPNAKTVTSIMRMNFPSKYIALLLKPDLILAQSRRTMEEFTRIGCKTVLLVCGGVDTNRFTPVTLEAKTGLRKKYGVDENRFVILHVGPIRFGRNVKFMEKLQSEENQVVIVGSTSTKADQKIVSSLRRSGCIVWVRYFDHIEEIYALSDCYVFPVIPGEDFFGRPTANCIDVPLSVLEAMSCNLPVISTRFGALPELFKEGEGLYFADKEEDFIDALKKVKNCEGSKTREKVIIYSWENVGKRIEKIYNEISKQNGD
ncbi:MAG: glycosyltransferase family 4 protein [Candidatus Jordarchaeaceae archaeon]